MWRRFRGRWDVEFDGERCLCLYGEMQMLIEPKENGKKSSSGEYKRRNRMKHNEVKELKKGRDK